MAELNIVEQALNEYLRATTDRDRVGSSLRVRVPEQGAARHGAMQAYITAARRRLGVAISAAAHLPGEGLGIHVYGPRDSDEAERLVFPDALKLSVPEPLQSAAVIGRFATFAFRSLRGRLSSVQSADEYFK